MTHIKTKNNKDKPKNKKLDVLFLGRSNCDATEKALRLLKTLNCSITTVNSNCRGEKLPEHINQWHGEFIFCFRSLFILPEHIINKASIAAVNFHPAPVEYPGSGCINFALYDDAKNYGVTAHLMNKKIDNGAIIECRRFPLLPTDTIDTLLERTHIKLLDLFFDVATELSLGGSDTLSMKLKKFSSEKWRGEARKIKDLDKLQIIPTDITEENLKKTIRATYTEKFPPAIKLHGYEFTLKSPNKSY